MNTQYHTPSFGDDVIDGGASSISTPTTGMSSGNFVNSMFTYQQTPTSTQTKHMINLDNTSSDEYHTANEDSFNFTANNSMSNSIIQQNTNSTPTNVIPPTATGNTTGPTTMAARKQMVPLDQNEPAKPLSAYALFFRDTVSAIKQQNPTCSFQELSKIVASMWDALDPGHKGVYNKKNELAKAEYIKQMRLYQQQQQQQLNANTTDSMQIQQQQQQTIQTTANVISKQQQQNMQVINNNNNASQVTTSASTSSTGGAPSGNQSNLPAEAGSLQKCTRENCNRRAIINPDWEDEYCSNECVVIHCRNVFNAWVQSNLEAKQQQQHTSTT